MTTPTYNWDQLIEADRVRASVYTDPRIFELEMQRIFERTWVYVGHESQVPNVGDYYATQIGRHPVVMVRTQSGEIAVLRNRCAHKGAQIVANRSGNVKAFRCAYHGWCYRLDGSRLAIPASAGYDGTCFGRDSTEARMVPAARMDGYRGFVFASLAASGPTLLEWLGGARLSIDNMVDRSPEGTLEVTGVPLRQELNANWKFHVENLNDLMHPMVAHQSASQAGRKVADERYPRGGNVPSEIEIIAPFTNNYAFFDEMGVTALEHGHSYSGGQVSIHSAYSDIPEYQAAMERAYGLERTREILGVNRHNTVVYPSLTLKGAIQTVRVLRPIAVDRTLIESWTFRLKAAPQALLRRSVLYCTLINSSAGIIQPDDHEAYIRMQSALQGEPTGWVSMHRYLGNETSVPEEGGRRALGTSDVVFRNQFAAWKDLMRQEDWA